MSKPTYAVREEKDDPLSHVLVKQNAEVEFTLSDLLAAEEQMGKMLTETRAQMDLEVAKMKNVKHHHEDAVALVVGLDPQKQKAVQIWLNAKMKVDELGPMKDTIVDAIKTDQAERETILEATGLALPEEYVPVDVNGTPEKNDEEVAEEGEPESDEAGEQESKG